MLGTPPEKISILLSVVALVVSSAVGCSLAPSGSFDTASRIPDRGFSPWKVAALETCIDDHCDSGVGASIESVGLRFDDEGFTVVAAIDGALYLGTLDPAIGRLNLVSPPVLIPTASWQQSGLVDPTFLSSATGLQILYATADGTALGAATLKADGFVDGEAPFATAASLGVSTVREPTAISDDTSMLLAFSSADGIHALSGPSLGAFGPDRLILDAHAVVASRWQDVDQVKDPDLVLLEDGGIGLFFSGHARVGDSKTRPDSSIGFAGSRDGTTFEAYAGNPVHDEVYNLIFHADETHPAVAFAAESGVMLVTSDRETEQSLGLAVHEPR